MIHRTTQATMRNRGLFGFVEQHYSPKRVNSCKSVGGGLELACLCLQGHNEILLYVRLNSTLPPDDYCTVP